MGPLDRMLQTLNKQREQRSRDGTDEPLNLTAPASARAPNDANNTRTAQRAVQTIVKKRRKVYVTTVSNCLRVVKWMVRENERSPKHLITHAICAHPQCFPGRKGPTV